MTNQELFTPKRPSVVWIFFLACLTLSLVAFLTSSLIQSDFGRVSISNVTYPNANGIPIRTKLFVPKSSSTKHTAPGIVYIHGYQNNRETSDAYCIEMARRGFVVLEIDAIGRGNSGNPGDIKDPTFDPTYGGRTSLHYLKSLPSVDPARIGLMGHSLGAEMAYNIALSDPSVRALAFSGFAYTTAATRDKPSNMVMIYGQYDEYRKRMTGTSNFAKEWMNSPQTQSAFPVLNPSFGKVYGDFNLGTARQVVLLPTIHLFESHSRQGIAAAVNWMRQSLHPADAYWIEPTSQIWEIKEWATLVAMLAGLASLMPLGLILLRTPYFSTLRGQVSTFYTCTGLGYLRHAGINGLLMWLYLPLIFILFGLHVYVVHIDKAFPMMMVNGTVWWFVWMNIIGFFILRRWRKRKGISWANLGISFDRNRFVLDGNVIAKTALLAGILFLFAYLFEHVLERIFIVDYRFLFPFASDLTLYRVGMWFLYFPFLLIGFLLTGFFLHGQLKLAPRKTWQRTFLVWASANTLALVIPLILFLMIQYVPLLTRGVIPFVGPGGVLANFTMSLFHIIGVLIMVTPLSTWFFQLTGRPYLGAFVNAALVTWMFVSSQVIAPIPV